MIAGFETNDTLIHGPHAATRTLAIRRSVADIPTVRILEASKLDCLFLSCDDLYDGVKRILKWITRWCGAAGHCVHDIAADEDEAEGRVNRPRVPSRKCADMKSSRTRVRNPIEIDG